MIISSMSKAVRSFTLLMMLTKNPVLRIAVVFFFPLELSSFHVYCIPKLKAFLRVSLDVQESGLKGTHCFMLFLGSKK